ncbi:MAG TPA: DUF4173 domain-containing protein [Anaerolineales bacterium]|nr:DUF4173 domain-containing protein [Anaerolineales bacterium]
MKANPNRFWFLVILLGWVFDYLFWKKTAGINFFLYVTLCLAAGMYVLQADGLRLARRAGLLLFPILFLSSMAFIRQEPMTVFLSIAMTLFLMGVFTLSYLNGQWTRYGLIDYIFGYLTLFASVVVRPLGFASDVRSLPSGQPSLGRQRGARVWPILRGLIIALPVVAIFASLLSSADPIFADRFEKFIELFNLENLPEYIFRLVYILVFAYAFAGIFLHAAQKSGQEVEEKSRFAPFLGFTESAIVLGSVVILFTAFVVIQFQYFFGGQANIHLDGYTYSEYARKGFGELVAVAFFSLLLVLGLGAITRRETETQRRTFSTLSTVLVGLVIVMLVSAFQRLVLYESVYGFSRLRTYTHVFMIWLALLLVIVVALELTRRERAVGLALVLSALGFVISLNLLNVDAFIVNQNIQRELRGDVEESLTQGGRVELDAQYFLDLSDDAVPALAAAFEDDNLPTAIREKVGAALFCKQFDREQEDRKISWQAFHVARSRADRIFARIKNDLDAYQVVDTDWPITIKTPTGNEFYCQPYYYD